MNVAACLLEVGAPDAVAVIDHGGAATTYRALRDEVQRVAAHLQAQGFEAGARAVLVAENNLFFIAAYLGTLRAGGVVVPVAPHITPEELS
ncbi:MAG TPA: AMP-binding protein, partial [Labilithrix sp.]|nr:AMP-binding protein [Labilithrix sp.]